MMKKGITFFCGIIFCYNFWCKCVCTSLCSLTDAENEDLLLYPYPAINEIFVKGAKNQTVKIYDYVGRLVKQERINEKLYK